MSWSGARRVAAVWFVVMAVLGVVAGVASAADYAGAGFVERVVDGDTLDVRWPDGAVTRVRLVGVDTPESRGRRECYGREASGWVARYLPVGRRVWVEFDPRLETSDRYGRTLGWVRKPGHDWMNRILVRRGLAAPAYFRYGRPSRANSLMAAQRAAIEGSRGAWRWCARARFDVNPRDGWQTGAPAPPPEGVS